MNLEHLTFHTGAPASIPLNSSAARDILDELFTHSDCVSNLFLQELQQTGAILPPPPLRVVTIVPAGSGTAQFSMETAQNFQREMYQLVPKYIQVEGLFCYLQGALNGIVSVKDDETLQVLYDSLRRLIDIYPAELRPHAAISSSCLNLRNISHACEENHEANAYERFLTVPIDVIVQTGDMHLYDGSVKAAADDDQVFGRLSQKICNAMIVEDRKLLHQTVEEVLDVILAGLPRISAIHMRAIHFCKPLEMVLVEENIIDRLFVEQFHLVARLIETENETALRLTFHREMDAVADYAAHRKQMQASERMRRVMDYIDENQSDCMLSAATISQHFRISQARLAADFRSYFQMTVQEAIHQKRVQFLKQKLTETNKPVKELAMDAGYVSVATMNRAFLRIEGVYPGQYRRQFTSDTHKSGFET